MNCSLAKVWEWVSEMFEEQMIVGWLAWTAHEQGVVVRAVVRAVVKGVRGDACPCEVGGVTRRRKEMFQNGGGGLCGSQAGEGCLADLIKEPLIRLGDFSLHNRWSLERERRHEVDARAVVVSRTRQNRHTNPRVSSCAVHRRELLEGGWLGGWVGVWWFIMLLIVAEWQQPRGRWEQRRRATAAAP